MAMMERLQVYLAKRRTLKEMGRPMTIMWTSSPKIRS
jgi:hypothetical protein